MRNVYKSSKRAQAAFFAHRLAIIAKILTPVPYVSFDEKRQVYIKRYTGGFKNRNYRHVGNINSAIKFSDGSFLLKPNVIRLLIFSYCFGLYNSLRGIYWSDGLEDFVFTNFDDPFEWAKSEKYMKLLDESPPKFIEQEGEDMWKRIYNSRGLHMFGKSDFQDHLPEVFKRMELFKCGSFTTE